MGTGRRAGSFSILRELDQRWILPTHPYTHQELDPNDFATRVVRHAQDRFLGERLGVVDSFDFDGTEALRAELVGIIGGHLDHASMPVSARVSGPFEFVRSDVIEVDLYLEAATLQEFRDPELMAANVRRAKEYARFRFLITRQLQDYLGVMIHLSCQVV